MSAKAARGLRLRRTAVAFWTLSWLGRLNMPSVRWRVPRGLTAVSGMSKLAASVTSVLKAAKLLETCDLEVGVIRGIQRKCV